jgi:hypothetical protein
MAERIDHRRRDAAAGDGVLIRRLGAMRRLPGVGALRLLQCDIARAAFPKPPRAPHIYFNAAMQRDVFFSQPKGMS